MKNTFLYLIFILVVLDARAQLKPQNGVVSSTPQCIAFTNAKIYVSPQQIIDEGTILIKNDKIVSVGKKVKIPSNAIVID
jgi:imidazolonepropionase-like amidohydrolase